MSWENGIHYVTAFFLLSAANLGCFVDNPARILQGNSTSAGDMTPAKCASFCQGYTYAGVEFATQCFCGNAIVNGSLAASGDCYMLCAGDANQMCGGTWRINVQQIQTKASTKKPSLWLNLVLSMVGGE